MSNILIKSGDKFFYKLSSPTWLSYDLPNTLVDGKQPDKLDKGWFLAKEKPVKISRVQKKREYTNWSLKEEYAHINMAPTVEKFEEDEDGDYPAESLFYKRNFIEEESTEELNIEWDEEIEEDVEAPVIFNATDSYYSEKTVKIAPMSSLVDSLLYHDIILPSKSCALTGDQMYKIIRHHVKNNIDTKYAKITSDYNFCFTVKKLLAISPETHSYDARTGRQRTPRIKSYTITDRESTVFEMTPPSEKYKGYTVMQGLRADSHAELKKKLDKMLKELMDEINKPLASCLACEGTGVVAPKKVSINE